jgi:hypothetical protein
MMINEQLVSVTTNLHEAIVHMRRTLPSINLGVDALSINLGGISERTLQVSQVSAIYSEGASQRMCDIHKSRTCRRLRAPPPATVWVTHLDHTGNSSRH